MKKNFDLLSGIIFGIIFCLTSLNTQIVKDIDGNVYNTVTIGSQVWMKENLKVTHYRNGDVIPEVTDVTSWSGLITGAYCNYNNDAGNVPTYGRLYNWYTVVDSRNLYPTGWHVPSDAEWTTLETYLGIYYLAGGKLKETGIIHWQSPNTGADNSSGFTALPGGQRSKGNNGVFVDIGRYGYWWTTSALDNYSAWAYSVGFSDAGLHRGSSYKQNSFSVRCVKE